MTERFFRVSGKSMFPYIRENDVLWVEPFRPRDGFLRRGQIVLARAKDPRDFGGLFVHRHVHALELKGDGNGRADHQAISDYEFEGLVRGRVRGDSWVDSDRLWIRCFHRLQARLSRGTLHRRSIVRRASSVSLKAVGFSLRLVEEIW